MRLLVAVCLSSFAALVVACGGGGTPSTAKKSHQEYEHAAEGELFNAEDVIAVMKQNEVRFDEKYKGKYFSVQGEVSRITDDLVGNKIVALKAGNGFSDVHCTFRDGVSVSKLNTGDTARITGSYSGIVIGSVMMKDCIFWEPSAKKEPAAKDEPKKDNPKKKK